MSGVNDRVLEGLGPALRDAAGPVLDDLVHATTVDLEVLDDLTRPTERGWAAVVDLDTTPDPAWFGRVTGTSVPAGLTLEQKRAFVRDRPAWRRGSVDAIAAAILAVLPAGARVAFLERPDARAWHLGLLVRSEHTSSTEAAVLAAAATQKPVGLVLDGVEFTLEAEPPGVRWWRPSATTTRYARLKALAPTYAAARAKFPTYRDARDHNPQEG